MLALAQRRDRLFPFNNMTDNTKEAFFALLRAGLWEKDVRLAQYGEIDYEDVLRLSEEQSLVGLVTAGMEQVADVNVPQEWVLQFVGETLQIEQQNKDMNLFIAELIEKLRDAGIYTLLVKGQGVAQFYERPLWRASGDVDFFLSEDNYQKAKTFLLPLATDIEPEGLRSKHLGMTVDGWGVELHGRLVCGLSSKVDKVLDEIQKDTFYGGNVKSWNNNGSQIFLLGVENNAFYVFTHFLSHFYKGGIGLRQICDWCRLLWTYREKLNHGLLESRIKKAGLMSEWRAFGAFAVEYLGMPLEAMPLYNENDNQNENLKRKAERIMEFIMMSGNFGHNRDMSYYDKYPYLVRKVISLGRRCGDLLRHARIFPLDSMKFFPYMMYCGVRSAVRGE